MSWNYHWRTSPDVRELEQTIDQLRTTVIRLRRQLNGKDQYISRLKFLVQERLTRIDDQRGRIEQLQERNRRLDEEAECYAAMIQRGPLREQY